MHNDTSCQNRHIDAALKLHTDFTSIKATNARHSPSIITAEQPLRLLYFIHRGRNPNVGVKMTHTVLQ